MNVIIMKITTRNSPVTEKDLEKFKVDAILVSTDEEDNWMKTMRKKEKK